MSVPDGDPTKDLFASTSYAAARAPRREFQGWHRPRKQFVRRWQWAEQITRMYEARNQSDPLRYMGLPGPDLMDLRYFHGMVCGGGARTLTFLGFTRLNPEDQTEMNISLSEVRSLANVDPLSEVLLDDFRALAHPHSIAWKRAVDLGPFDVVNLDLCDGIVADDPSLERSLYNAVSQLLSLQLLNHRRWLLLITTRVGRNDVHPAALQRLLDQCRQNADACQGFKDESRMVIGTELEELDPSSCTDDAFAAFVTLALCKWLLGTVCAAGNYRVELHSSLGYRIVPGPHVDMVSLAMSVRPGLAKPPDPGGLVSVGPAVVDECADATRIARRVGKTRDVDAYLAENSGDMEEATSEMVALLRSARYDVSVYRAWLAGGT